MRGRPRKPTAVKKLQGTLEKSRLVDNEPVPSYPLTRVKAPDYLSDKGKELWDFALSQAPEQLITTLDFGVFAIWADTYSKIIELEADIQREGMFEVNSNGALKRSEKVKLQNELKTILFKSMTELGFTPASRSRISVAKTDKTEKKNGFLEL